MQTRQLMVLLLIFWCGVTVMAWFSFQPVRPLVGVRAGEHESVLKGVPVPDLQEAQQVLEQTLLWGVGRDGKPLPPPKTAAQIEEENAPLKWQVLSAVVREGERYILIAGPKLPMKVVREGEALPNESTLVSVTPKRVVYEDAEKATHTLILNF